MLRRAAVLTAIPSLLLGALVAAGPASASPSRPAMPPGFPSVAGLTVSGPIPQTYDPSDEAAGFTCPFPLHEDFPVSDVVGYTFTTKSGRVAAEYFTGPLFMTVTRTDTGKQVTVDISGKALEVFHTDGSLTLYGLGPFSTSQHPGDDPGPELTVLHGFSVLDVGADGHKTIVYSSYVENLCTELD